MDTQLRQASRGEDISLYILQLLRAGEIELKISQIAWSNDFPLIDYTVLKGEALLSDVLQSALLVAPHLREDDNSDRYHLRNVRVGASNYVIHQYYPRNTLRVYWDKTFKKKELPSFIWYLATPLLAKLKEKGRLSDGL